MSNDKTKRPTYAVIGLGFVADKHIAAISSLGGEILAGCDIDVTKAHKIGEAKFFTNWEKMLDDPVMEKVDYVAVCTPNYLHYPMAYQSAKKGKKVILEKPTVLYVDQFNSLKEFDECIYPVFQLRYNKGLKELKKRIDDEIKFHSAKFAVCVHRDEWYFTSWKNKKEESGGLMFNIGVHYFDLFCWLFGTPLSAYLSENRERYAKGSIQFDGATTEWELSIEQPHDNQYRYLEVDGEKINLSLGFENLHNDIYKSALVGKKIPLSEIETTIKLLDDYGNRS